MPLEINESAVLNAVLIANGATPRRPRRRPVSSFLLRSNWDSGALQLSTRDDQQDRQRDDHGEFEGGRDSDQHGHRHGVATVIG